MILEIVKVEKWKKVNLLKKKTPKIYGCKTKRKKNKCVKRSVERKLVCVQAYVRVYVRSPLNWKST